LELPVEDPLKVAQGRLMVQYLDRGEERGTHFRSQGEKRLESGCKVAATGGASHLGEQAKRLVRVAPLG
jgi:hypothetical protein